VAGADHYYLYVLDDTTNVAVVNQPTLPIKSFSSPPLAHGHRYTWWVAAVSTNNLIAIWDTPQDFTIS
jgi:hypothetical protein